MSPLKADSEKDNPIIKTRRPSLTKMMSNLFSPKEQKITPVTPKGKSPRNSRQKNSNFTENQISQLELFQNSVDIVANPSSQMLQLGDQSSTNTGDKSSTNAQNECDRMYGINIRSFSSSSEYQDLLDSMALAMEPKHNTKGNVHYALKLNEVKEIKSTSFDYEDDGDSVFDSDSDTTFEESSVSASESADGQIDENDQQLSSKYVEFTNGIGVEKPLNKCLGMRPLRLDIDNNSALEKISRTFANQSYKFTKSGLSVIKLLFK